MRLSEAFEETAGAAHELVVLDATGDTKIIWDPDRADEVAVARRTFEDLKKKGYAAYAVKRDGSKGEVVRAFDADAEKLILAPATVGG